MRLGGFSAACGGGVQHCWVGALDGLHVSTVVLQLLQEWSVLCPDDPALLARRQSVCRTLASKEDPQPICCLQPQTITEKHTTLRLVVVRYGHAECSRR